MNRALDRRTRKFLFQMLVGALIGAASMFLLLALARDAIEQWSRSQMVAGCVGVIYAIIGAFVAVGAAAPKLGASVLNVEDAEELLELRGSILPSGFACIAVGSFLLALTVAPAADESSRTVALAIAALSLAASIMFGVIAARRLDELSRLLGAESAMLALYAVSTLFGVWAALAQLGFAEWVDPLAFVAATAAIQLLSAFVVVGKRGMLLPR